MSSEIVIEEGVMEAETKESTPTPAPELPPAPAPESAPEEPASASPGDAIPTPAPPTATEMPLEVPAEAGPAPNVSKATNDFRRWKDNTGQYETRAQLVSLDGPNVRLLKSDGQQCVVPLERLSDDDRQYVLTIGMVVAAY